MRVLHVASEVAPWSQSGGLADVAAALPAALAAAEGAVETAVATPLYPSVRSRLAAAGTAIGDGLAHEVVLGGVRFPVRLRPARPARGPALWLVESPLFEREGLYVGDDGVDYPDNHLRFGVLCKAAVDLGDVLLGGPLDVLHGHDWQAALAPVFLRLDPARGRTAAVMTVHNLAYRGLAAPSALGELGLPDELFTVHRMEFYGQLCLLKGGLAFADANTTVSPTYAREILTPERGEGLDGFLRWDTERLVGIVNGIDDEMWDPAVDDALAATYSAAAPAAKVANRAALVAELGFLGVDDATPIIGVVSRLAGQKGLDLVADLVPELATLGARLVVLGSGEKELERRFRWLGDTFRDHLRAIIGFDVALSRRIYGGSDLFLMPSRFEPCGIGQMYAMRYGAVPVVHAVGGLVDTVLDPGDAGLAAGAGTGFRFEHPTLDGLRWALGRAIAMFRGGAGPDAWPTLVAAAMRRDSSWRASAREYLQLYRAAVRARC
jgi:starch synthase